MIGFVCFALAIFFFVMVPFVSVFLNEHEERKNRAYPYGRNRQ